MLAFISIAHGRLRARRALLEMRRTATILLGPNEKTAITDDPNIRVCFAELVKDPDREKEIGRPGRC